MEAAPMYSWVVGFAGVLVILKNTFDFYKAHIKEQPTASKTYATKVELSDFKQVVRSDQSAILNQIKDLQKERSVSVGRLHDKVDSANGAMRREMKEDVIGLHNRLTEVLAAVSELKGRVDSN